MKPRVLVRLPSWLGDAVQAEPALRALYETYAEVGAAERVTLAGPAPLVELLSPAFPLARTLPHSGRGGEQEASWRGHDVAVLFTGSFRSAWTAWRARIRRRVGWSRDARGWLLTDRMRPALERGGTPLGLGVPGRAPRRLPRPFVSVCVELVGLLGVSVADTRPRLIVKGEARTRARKRRAAAGVAEGEPYVVVNAGSRPGSAKGYPPELWGAVLSQLESCGLPAFVAGGPGEEAPVRAAVASAAGAGRMRAIACVDPVADLPELAALAAEAEVVLTADSGPRHVACAVGAPVVCVAGPTDPRHSGILERTVVLRREVWCGPCHLEVCPLEGDDQHACMRLVEPAAIARAAMALLDGAGVRAGIG